MSLLQAIYFVGAIAIGTFLGVVLEYFIDVQLMRDLQNENRLLRLKLAEAKKTRKVEHIETLEIIDHRASNPTEDKQDEDDFFKPF